MNEQIEYLGSFSTEQAMTIKEKIEYLEKEVARLKRGDFTPEELQTLCHNLPEEKKIEFFNGCYKNETTSSF